MLISRLPFPSRRAHILAVALSLSLIAPTLSSRVDGSVFHIDTQKRVSINDTGKFETVVRKEQWDSERTAVIVCDVWDLHHCKNAVSRVKEMAPRMNQLLEEAREAGALIIHSPSGCVDFYQGHPARLRAQNVPRSKNLPKDIGSWCYQIPAEEQGVYPLDQSDGGEDDDPVEHEAWAQYLADMGRNPRSPWIRQYDVIKIQSVDAITDNGEEVWSLLEHHDIDNVLLLGVHTNMCVLGRPFGLRQLSKNGKNVVLVRDMTDSMYNPKMWPYVNHYRGTDLIIEHIEKFVCSTTTSDQILGGKPFRFSGDPDR